MRYELLALDMDGTLLASNKRILPRTKEALARLSERGVSIAFCTGRCVCELMEYPSELPFVRYAVLSSGALVYDFSERKPLEAHPLDTPSTLAAMELSRDLKPMVHMMSMRMSVARPDDIRVMERFGMGVYKRMFERICTPTVDLDAWVVSHPNEVLKLNLYFRNVEDRMGARHRLEEAGLPLTLINAEQTSLECSARGVSKGEGTRTLAQRLGIGMEQVVAIGDSDNDLEVLRSVGMPVAMGNATDPVRQVARLLVADNDHDGIVEAIERLF